MKDDKPICVGDRVVTYRTVLSELRGTTLCDGVVYTVEGPMVGVDFAWKDEDGIERFECVPYLVHDFTWDATHDAWSAPAFSERMW